MDVCFLRLLVSDIIMVEEVWLQHNDSCVVFDVEGRLDVKDIAKVWNLDPSSLVIASRKVKIGDDGLSTRSIDDFRGVEKGRDGRSQEKALTVKGQPSAVNYVGVKRQRLGNNQRKLERDKTDLHCGFSLEALKEQEEKIRSSYFPNKPEFLWDSTAALVVPSSYPPFKESLYVGRVAAKEFYHNIMKLEPWDSMLVIGAKGSGKSTVVQAIVGHMIACQKPALYLHGSKLRKGNKNAQSMDKALMIKALLAGLRLAFCTKDPESSELSGVSSWEEIKQWCALRGERFYIFVDDWENDLQELADALSTFKDLILVKISSTNSEARRASLDTDKPDELYGKIHRFDGPYRPEELRTWIDNSELRLKFEAKILSVLVEKWTGGMPRLLKKLETAEGDEEKMKSEMKYYETRLQRFIYGRQTRKELFNCLESFLTTGADFSCDFDFDSACFYQDEKSKWHILCPYLQRQAEIMIMDREKCLNDRLRFDDIQMWAQAVRLDCILDCKKGNPARLGWNVEGLVIEVIRYMGSVFMHSFGSCISYDRGKEADILKQQPQAKKEKGILMIPVRFNEEAVDIFHVILKDGVYILVGIQISVGSWKVKMGKGSHETWKSHIDKTIKPALVGSRTEESFIYVMPKSVDKQDDECEKDFQRKALGDIHDCLKWIDEEFQLQVFAVPEPHPRKQCQGETKGGQKCRVWGRSKDANFFCRHHKS